MFNLPGSYIIQYLRTKAIRRLFPLCFASADTTNQGDCTHSDEERCIVGTWVVDEVSKAVEVMFVAWYMCMNFWVYSVTRFEKGEGGLFAEFFNMCLKLK
jgi:hypothetical protein